MNDTSTDDALAAEKGARVGALSAALTSRIAWDRVLRQVSLVLPEDVWLTSLSATAPTAAAPAPMRPRHLGLHPHRLHLLPERRCALPLAARRDPRPRERPAPVEPELRSSTSASSSSSRSWPTSRARRRGGWCGLVKLKLDTRTLGVIAGVCILLYAAAGYFLVVSPKKGEAARLGEEIAATNVELVAARAARGAAQDDTQPIAVADIFRLATAMPSSPDMPGILLELSRIAEETGIRFKSITPQSALADRRVPVGADRRDLRRLLLRTLGLPLPPAHARLGPARRAARGRASLLRRDRRLLGGRSGFPDARRGAEAPGLRLRHRRLRHHGAGARRPVGGAARDRRRRRDAAPTDGADTAAGATG